MSDRELLELAAKAAGYDAEYQDWPGMDVRYGFSQAVWSEKLCSETSSGYWNPLEDDGHAFRLAVKLGLGIDAHQNSDLCSPFVAVKGDFDDFELYEDFGGDPCAATRRAIVRAAAEIGRAMP